MQKLKPGSYQIIEASAVAAGTQLPAEVYLKHWTPAERRARALRALAACWLACLFSVAIPMLHFVLVPLLFLSGLIVPYFVYRKQSVVLGGTAACPHCAQSFPLLRCPDAWPLQQICKHCDQHVRVERVVRG